MKNAFFCTSKYTFRNIEILYNTLRTRVGGASCKYTTTVDAIDAFSDVLMQKNINENYKPPLTFMSKSHVEQKINKQHIYSVSYILKITSEQLDKLFLESLSNHNGDREIKNLISACCEVRRLASESVLIKLFRAYSLIGKTDIVTLLQDYCKLDPIMCTKHGYFQQYLARAQCMKGNSEKGLALLKETYSKYVNLRCFCRCIFKELIQDSVLNRSEASLVVFKKYVIEFSNTWKDHYPVICLWHICWSSTWFSDQIVSNELLDESENLRNVIKEKATEFAINVLQNQRNEDAVVRLLQSLLKYNMMLEYAKVLQVLFNYKLKNRDVRGCTEIIKNCKALGIVLPSLQQSLYIDLLINGKVGSLKTSPSKTFKLKF